MQPQVLFQVGFFTLATAVLAMIVAGATLWIRWWRGKRTFNLVGEANEHLITPQPQPVPRWSVFDFLFLFGVMILTASLLHQSLARQPQGEPKADTTIAQPEVSQPPSAEEDAPTENAAAENAAADGSGTENAVAENQVSEPPGVPDSDAAERAATLTRSQQLQIHFAANLIALLCTLGYLRLVHHATLQHLTLIPTRRDVRRGLIATVWILAPVLLINMIVSSLVKYEHSVTDLLAEQNRFSTFVFLFLSAAVLTPVIEEFQFRLLLQGGLQKLADFGVSPTPPAAHGSANFQPTSLWPVIVTSLVFGLMHFGQGAAPIPLFFLSIGLGMVYQRTGRLFPSIVIHMVLNAATLVMEFCRLNAGLDAL